MKICPVCGKEFTRINAKYCSETCKAAAAAKRAREKYHHNKKEIVLIEKTCKICGQKFKTNMAHKKYCSPECYNKNAHNLTKKKYFENKNKPSKTKPKPEPQPKKDWQIYDMTRFDFGQSRETIPKACLKCEYCRRLTTSSYGMHVCHYCIDTGEPRGCSTKECVENKVHFKPRPRKKKQGEIKNARYSR